MFYVSCNGIIFVLTFCLCASVLKLSVAQVISLTEYSRCTWDIGLTLSRAPFTVTRAYFDDKGQFDTSNLLQRPNVSNYVSPTKTEDGTGNFAFPYFVLVRGVCDTGFYDNNYYRLIMYGAHPEITLSYFPRTSRDKRREILSLTTTGVLVDLQPDSGYVNVPKNPSEPNCNFGVCYPGFLVPQVFLKSRFENTCCFVVRSFESCFEASVETIDEFRETTKRIYVSPYTSREAGYALDVAASAKPRPADFFPVVRIGNSEDPDGLTKIVTDSLVDDEHFPLDKDDFLEPKFTLGQSPVVYFAGFYNPNLLIATDPDLNDITIFRWGLNPLEKDHADKLMTIFDHGLTCTLDTAYQKGNNDQPIPLYARGEGPLSFSWIGSFYRKRYTPLKYLKKPIPQAVFDIVALEDRLLLVTNNGLIPYYGTTNATLATGKNFRSPEEEKLRRCFKLVRTSKIAGDQDFVVGVTYRYNHKSTIHATISKQAHETESTVQTIQEEIWVGRLQVLGEALEWKHVGSRQLKTANAQHDDQVEPQADLICGIVLKNEDFHQFIQDLELNGCWIQDAVPANDGENIQVLIEMQLTHLPTKNVLESQEGHGFLCGEELLTFYIIASHAPFSGTTQVNAGWKINAVIPRRARVTPQRQSVQNIATFSPEYFRYPGDDSEQEAQDEKLSDEEEESSELMSPLQQLNTPDGDDDEEDTMESIDRRRRQEPQPESTMAPNPGTGKEVNKLQYLLFRQNLQHDLYLTRLTYTRQLTRHLYLYGNRLVQSTDGGGAFAHMTGFPAEDELLELSRLNRGFEKAKDAEKRRRYYAQLNKLLISHVIKVITFSNTGHYAFLTSKRHLYWGSLGTAHQIRLRPSPGYSVIRTMLSHRPGLHDGRPFSLMFDSFDRLYELIAVVDSKKRVTEITKRVIPWNMIIANNNFVEKLLREAGKDSSEKPLFRKLKGSRSKAELNAKLKYLSEKRADVKSERNVFDIGIAKFKDFCPYGDQTVTQNYTQVADRVQHLSVLPPKQHESLGIAASRTLIMTFQAIVFSLVHNVYYSQEKGGGSKLDYNAFEEWQKKTGTSSQIGAIKYLVGDPAEHGIIFDPAGTKQLSSSSASSKSNTWIQRYYLDFDEKVEITVGFSLKTRASIDKTDFRTQRLSSLQITIDNSNGSLLEVETDRRFNAKAAGVTFHIYLSLNRRTGTFRQIRPGKHSAVIPLSIYFLNAFEACTPTVDGSFTGDSLHTTVYAGCLPNRELRLDYNHTLRSLRFRNPKSWMGTGADCFGKEVACFYSRTPIIFHFEIFDPVLKNRIPYDGRYTLTVIGGGYSRDTIQDYSEEELKAYNVPGHSDVSLVWIEWDIKNNRKVQAKALPADIKHLELGESVLKSGQSAIKWTCNEFSPCARVAPTWSLQSVYYFKLRISNEKVEKGTLCLYERDIVIQLYGFQPSPEIQLLLSVVACILILLLMYLYYVCSRNDYRVWKSNQVELYGWLQIIVDTFPKPSRVNYHKQELLLQLKRDELLLSLRGHLGVPEKLKPSEERHRRQDAPNRPVDEQKPEGESSSSKSGTGDSDSDNLEEKPIAKVLPRRPAATWTDMVFNQLIQKRATAIKEGERKERRAMFAQVFKDPQLTKDHEPTKK